jgi:hypothetical protein
VNTKRIVPIFAATDENHDLIVAILAKLLLKNHTLVCDCRSSAVIGTFVDAIIASGALSETTEEKNLPEAFYVADSCSARPPAFVHDAFFKKITPVPAIGDKLASEASRRTQVLADANILLVIGEVSEEMMRMVRDVAEKKMRVIYIPLGSQVDDHIVSFVDTIILHEDVGEHMFQIIARALIH